MSVKKYGRMNPPPANPPPPDSPPPAAEVAAPVPEPEVQHLAFGEVGALMVDRHGKKQAPPRLDPKLSPAKPEPPPESPPPTPPPVVLTDEQILQGLSHLTKHGTPAQQTQAYRMLMAARDKRSLAVEKELTEEQIDAKAAVMLSALGVLRAQKAWIKAFGHLTVTAFRVRPIDYGGDAFEETSRAEAMVQAALEFHCRIKDDAGPLLAPPQS